GGSSWISQASFLNDQLFGVSFTNDSTGLAVGRGASGGLVMRTTNGGGAWMRTLLARDLYAVSSFDVSQAVAVGWLGYALRTANRGASWMDRSPGGMVSLVGVSMVNADTGTAVGDAGTILRTID